MTMTELCAELRNYFDRGLPKYFGEIEIRDGNIDIDGKIDLANGQYFRIEGSVFNNGVHQYPDYDMADEVFRGSIWAMAVPPAVVALCEEMDKWEKTYAEEVKKPYSSETISGVYSYTRAQGGSTRAHDGSSGGSSPTVTAFDMFARKLNKWRKI